MMESRKLKKLLHIFFMVLVLSSLLAAQSLYTSDQDSLLLSDLGYEPDSALVAQMNPRKPLWFPIVESFGLSLALGSFNAYIANSEFAKISFKTIKHNYETGWTTDADGFITNMWAHPFNGSMYYNFARSSGYNYWTSLGVAAIGSWGWEFHMENEPPALNDWIMTSYGGSILGEMFYRFSNLILDESTTGWDRFWCELGAGIFNPARLFNRLVTGRTARVTDEKLYEKAPLMGELALGVNNVAEGLDFKNGQKNPMLTVDVTYGKLFEKQTLSPFDFFRFYGAFNFGGKAEDKQPLFGQFRIYDILYGKSYSVGEGSKFLWGIFGHFDYLENNVYQVGGVSTGLGVGYRTPYNKGVQFMGLLHAAALLMGGANSDYAPEYKVSFLDSARSYNMGPGAHSKLETILRFSFGSLYIGYSFWWIHTWDGAPGNEFIGMWTPKLRFQIFNRWYLRLEYLLYHRVGKYDNFPEKYYQNNEQRLFIGYAF
jgi:hypothetical protein